MDDAAKVKGGMMTMGDDAADSCDGETLAVPSPVVRSTTSTDMKIKRAHKKRKLSKGRLKKLWRKSTEGSGISSRAEYCELLELQNDWAEKQEVGNWHPMMAVPGPSVFASKQFQNVNSQWQVTEGSDHRDLIVNLLFGCDSDDEPSFCCGDKYVTVSPVPSWARIANQGGVNGLAVIEIEVIGGINECNSPCPLFPSQRIATSGPEQRNGWRSIAPLADGKVGQNKQHAKVIGAACKAKLFQGNKQPRNISEVLMLVPPQQSARESRPETRNDFNLIDAMKDLLLRPEQLKSEGYPIASSVRCVDSDRVKEQIRSMKQPQKKPAALDLVRALALKDEHVTLGREKVIPADDDEAKLEEYYVKTFEMQDRSEARVFSLDCEMVDTRVGKELARVSLIMHDTEEKYSTVVDELVRPRRSVVDYLTGAYGESVTLLPIVFRLTEAALLQPEFSGVTQDALQDVDTRIEDIQLRLLSVIADKDIIVGHSLENDLRALRLVHNNVIDTSVVFRRNDRKFSLRHLTNVLCQRKIQTGHGHCSVEDAEAAMVLAIRRARRGPSFGIRDNCRVDIMTAFQKQQSRGRGSDSFAVLNTRSCVCIGPADWIKRYAPSAGSHHILNCESGLDPMAMAIPSWLAGTSSKRSGLLWAHLVCEASPKKVDQELARLDELVEALAERVPSDTPILVMYQRNYKMAQSLTQQRKAALNPKSSAGWTSSQEESWKRLLEDSRQCEAMWIGTQSLTARAKKTDVQTDYKI